MEREFAGLVFHTRSGNRYLYDDNTGMVFHCPDMMLTALRTPNNEKKIDELTALFPGYSKQRILSYLHLINEFVSKHGSFFYNTRKGRPISILDSRSIENYLRKYGLRQMTMNVTEDCNLRCKYCFYSSCYSNSRTFSKNKMDFAVATKAIDYYFEFLEKYKAWNPYRRPAISFYGGEPLLEFDLIKKIIKYIKTKYYRDTEFNITTNGMLLEEKVIDYLVGKNVNIAISLDGPRDEHDRLRINRSGRGTFITVLRNTKLLKKKYPNYSKATLTSCYDWATNLFTVKSFFDKNQQSLPPFSQVSGVLPFGTTYYDRFDDKTKQSFTKQVLSLRDEYFSCAADQKEQRSNYLGALLGRQYPTILLREMLDNQRSSLNQYSGACIPGFKIFVSYNGIFHICEKTDKQFPIGNIDEGLEFSKIKVILWQFRERILSNCSLCPITRLCNICYVHFASKGTFNFDPRLCEQTIHTIRSDFSETYSILERNPKAYSEVAENYYRGIDVCP